MSERDEMRERWREFAKARDVILNFGTADALDFAQREADLAWNEGRDAGADVAVMRCAAELRNPTAPNEWKRERARVASDIDSAIRALKRPSPPAQQDDKPESVHVEAEVHAGTPSLPRTPAPFDVERRARELFGAEKGYLHAHEIQQDAIQLARETAESIAKSCEVAAKAKPNEGALAAALRTALTCAEIARRHCRPPEPETNEERVAMLERALRSVVDEYDANRCGTTSGWKREEPGARFVDAIDKARRALGGGA